MLLCALRLLLFPPLAKSTNDMATFILVGAKGDLARRFIWPAMLELLAKEDNRLSQSRLAIYAASREPASPSSLQDTFATLVEDNFDQGTLADTNVLLRRVEYVQLKTKEDYSKLNSLIVSRMESEKLSEVVRVYYLSVPPYAYEWIVSVINSVGRPASGQLRVVLEKPFGKDLTSAMELSSTLQRHLTEQEKFVVDHYLGKLGVQQISHFRRVNVKRLNPLWNSNSVQMVKIVASETVTAQGRTGYYDQYGVIRDMLQNHLTEILSLLLCDLDGKFSDKYSCNRKELLTKVYPPPLSSAIVGQYVGYTAHFQEDRLGSSFSNTSSSTPTFASVVLYIRDPRWMGVPFLLTSGKNMKKKSTYVQILFKDSAHCPAGSALECSTSPNQLVFMMDSHNPGVCFSTVLNGFMPPYDDWESTSCQKFPYFADGNDHQCTVKCFVPVLNFSRNAYTSVVSSAIFGSTSFFVSIEKQIQSWKIWTPLLNELEASKYQKMFLYTPESLQQSLIAVNGMELVIDTPGVYSFSTHSSIKVTSIVNNSEASSKTVCEIKSRFSKLVGVKVISDMTSNLASNLSTMIFLSALKAVKERGVFHLALPGGTSPLIVYQYLILNFRHLFPWHETHIWQTDERCADRHTSQSNLYHLSKYLLEYVPIPYQNIHPLPADKVCASFQESSTFHPAEVVPETGFDFVLLGVGLDGHIASVFPKSEVKFSGRHPPIEYVQLFTNSPVEIKSRITLDIEHLTNTTELGIMLMDQRKCDIVRTIGNMSEDSYSGSGDAFPFIRLLLHVKQHQLVNPIMLPRLNTVIFVEESCYDH